MNKLIKALSLSLGLLLSSIGAGEIENIETIHAGVNKLDDLLKMKLNEERQKLFQNDNPRGAFCLNASYLTTHPLAAHGIYKASAYFDKVELNDGSVWAVYYDMDRSTVSRWMAMNDQVIITPSTSFFSPTNYLLVSQRTNECVNVSLKEIEVNHDPYFGGQRLWIEKIDYVYDLSCGCFYYRLNLSDGSNWEVDSRDSSYCNLFYPGDVVFIGVDNSFGLNTNNILIHFNSLEYVHADCVSY